MEINNQDILAMNDNLYKKLSILNLSVHGAVDLIASHEQENYNSSGLYFAFEELMSEVLKQMDINRAFINYLDEKENGKLNKSITK